MSALVGMAECAVWRTVAQMMRSRRKRIIAMDGLEAADSRWHKVQELIDGHVRAGRVLPSERSRLAALLAALPDDEASAIVYAAADGSDNEMSETPAAILEGFLAILPRRRDYGAPGARRMSKRVDDENRAVAVAAHALMVKQVGK